MSTTVKRRSRTLGAHTFLDGLVDEGSFVSWDTAPSRQSMPEAYRSELEAAERRSGTDEAVVTGAATVGGRPVALVVSEFGFLAGSIGVHTAERIAQGFRRATAERLPLLAAPASGGTRMQEGTEAFLAMIGISAAVAAHREAGLPYLVYLRHPTTGGVMASWGSLGHVTAAEPEALAGFLGPRVYEGLYGRPFPAGVQITENLQEHGLVDAVVPPAELPEFVGRALALLGPLPAPGVSPAPADARGPAPREAPGTAPADVWDAVRISRDPRRPGVLELLAHGADEVLRLSGSGEGHREQGVELALAAFGAVRCVVVGQARTADGGQELGPDALRQARRGIRLAGELGLPLVTVIDTPGATLSVAAEEGGLAGQMARTLSELLQVEVPTVSVLLGAGTGGAAIALLPADRTVAAANSWVAPLPPEGASSIVHRTPDRAAEVVRAQRAGTADLQAAGAVDEIVAERPDAAAEPEAFCRRIAAAIERHVVELEAAADEADPSGGDVAGRRSTRYVGATSGVA